MAFAASASEQDVPIVREAFEIEGGNFKYGYESGNGIVQKTKGTLKNAGTEQEAQEIQGSVSYTSPEGVVSIHLTLEIFYNYGGIHKMFFKTIK